MSLFDGLPLPADPVPAVKEPERPYTVTIKRASNGAEILLCSVTPPPRDVLADARHRKLPVFTFAEIEPMRLAAAADAGFLELIIHTRRTFGWGGPVTFQGAA